MDLNKSLSLCGIADHLEVELAMPRQLAPIQDLEAEL
jgi:hypothetical protein